MTTDGAIAVRVLLVIGIRRNTWPKTRSRARSNVVTPRARAMVNLGFSIGSMDSNIDTAVSSGSRMGPTRAFLGGRPGQRQSSHIGLTAMPVPARATLPRVRSVSRTGVCGPEPAEGVLLQLVPGG